MRIAQIYQDWPSILFRPILVAISIKRLQETMKNIWSYSEKAINFGVRLDSCSSSVTWSKYNSKFL